MNVEKMKQMVSEGQYNALESAWMEAMEEGLCPIEMANALEGLAKKQQTELAETLASMLLEERAPKLDAPQALELYRAVLLAVPTLQSLRPKAAELYQQIHSAKLDPKFVDAILTASGLKESQSPRRALRTLETCLAIREGHYLANRFDHRVLKAGKFDEALGEFELFDAQNRSTKLEPKALADEFEIVGETDFRVLTQHRPDELKKLLTGNPGTLLAGLCQANGGSIDSDALKDRLVPKYIAAGQYSAWWSKARTAAKRSGQMSLEGRNPVTITYHAQGRSLEQELEPLATAAKTPQEQFAVLVQYARECRDRKLPLQAEFTAPLMSEMAQASVSYQARRPSDALAASLSIARAMELEIAAPDKPFVSAVDILATAASPAEAVAPLADESLWPAALDAMAQRPDAAKHLEALLELTPAGLLDEVASRLTAAGKTDAMEKIASAAAADPLGCLDVSLWLWKGPAVAPANAPGKVELLSRLLKAMHDMEHDWDTDAAKRKSVFQRLRNAFGASGFASFRQAVSEMSEAVAETIKRQIERSRDTLADAVHEEMLSILKESFYGLFVIREKIEPWADENTLWSTQSAMDLKQAEFKDLTEIKMLENARAIGAAAAHGDLSENSEWKFALEERDMLRARAAKMQDDLSKARAIHPGDVPTDHVGVGSKVTFKSVADGSALVVSFLGIWDTDLAHRVYSYKTPIAQSLMGKVIGDTVHLELDGVSGEFTIEKLESAV